VLDIGAYEGYWSKDIKELFPTCSPFMIEGNPEKNAKLEKSEFPFEIALLADKKKEVTFHQTNCEYNTGNSIYREQTIFFHDREKYYSQQLMTTTLEDVVKRNRLTNIDIIKMDVQGAEKDVIKGGLEVVKKCKMLILELPVAMYNAGAPTFTEMIIFLDQIGFKLFDIIDYNYFGKYNQLVQIDAIFIRKEL